MPRRFRALLLLAAPATLAAQPARQPRIGAQAAPVIHVGGRDFHDLNKNGTLEPYEDWRLAPDVRARDLVARMTTAEKAGSLLHGTAKAMGPMGWIGAGNAYDLAANTPLITQKFITAFITRLEAPAAEFARQNNALQRLAEGSRLGVPLTISTDPRHHFQEVLGASSNQAGFSQWPEPLGFGALRDPAIVRRFGDVARQEYRAVGIHEALSPQADLATEPRWSRIAGTFGEDADVVGPLVQAYVEGFQHGARGTQPDGVLAVVKHWVGYGASINGYDGHNAYGKHAAFPGNNLDYHVRPFLGAFASKVAAVMPTYPILDGVTIDGKPLEPVGANFNAQLLQGLLRTRHRFGGFVLSDWAIINDCPAACEQGAPPGGPPVIGMPWGVESLSRAERMAKAINAGVDQIGGSEEAELLLEAVQRGLVSEARLAEAAVRVLTPKFQQGLFEDPYVDADRAPERVGTTAFVADAMAAQRRALVLLENKRALLPLKAGTRVWAVGVDTAAVRKSGFAVAASPADAQVALVRLNAPFETLHPNHFFGSRQHEGNLGFLPGDTVLAAVQRLAAKVPVVATIYLDRPAILTPLRDTATALLGNFGVSDAALLDVLAGRDAPRGKLPFELPSSMAAAEEQQGDVAHDSKAPLYPFGFGRRYAARGAAGR